MVCDAFITLFGLASKSVPADPTSVTYPHIKLVLPNLNTLLHLRRESRTQSHGNWRDNIKPASVTCPLAFSKTSGQKVHWMLPLCSVKVSTVFLKHTHTDTLAVTIKRALPVRVFHLVSVFSTDRDGCGVSLLAVLMWRDDTCGSWIERHKGF